MKPVLFTEANQNNEHGDLPCYVHNDGVICCWSASFKERIRLLFTGRIWMSVIGSFVPAISLVTVKPFVRVRVKEDALGKGAAGIGSMEESADEQ